MSKNFHHFEIEKSNTRFVSTKGTEYASTAKISFYDTYNHFIKSAKYGIADLELVYQSIENTGQINIDEAYVENFSLTTFRKTRQLDEHGYVDLLKINATGAFFYTTTNVDFSFSRIKSNIISMNSIIVFGGNLDFSHSKMSDVNFDLSYMIQHKGGLHFSNLLMENGSLSFRNSIFAKGDKLFQYARFKKTMVDFANCEFNSGDINIIDSHFSGGLSFKIARFGQGRISFQFAKFSGKDIHFDRAEFGSGNLDFRTTEFTNIKLSFNRCTATKGKWDFSGIEALGGKITFKKTEFGSGSIDFTDCKLKTTELIFNKAETHNILIVFENSQLGKLDFSHCFFNKFMKLHILSAQSIDLTYTVARDIIDLNYHDNMQEFPILNFTNMHLPGLLYCDWNLNRIKKSIYKQGETTTWRQKANQFLMIKENFKRNGQYDNEDFAYVEYRRSKAKSKKTKQHSSIYAKVSTFILHWLNLILLDLAGLYGTSPLRVFVTMMFNYIGFSVAYILIIVTKCGDIVTSVGNQYNMSIIPKSFYHSAVTMLTIGYGDHFPIGAARILSGVQGFVGMLLLSYFTVSLIHKILR